MTKIITCGVRTKKWCLCFHKRLLGLVSPAAWVPRRQRGDCCGYQDITFSLFVPWTSPFPLIASTSSVSMSRVLPLQGRADSLGWKQTPASSPGERLLGFPGVVLVEVLKSKNKNTQECIKKKRHTDTGRLCPSGGADYWLYC